MGNKADMKLQYLNKIGQAYEDAWEFFFITHKIPVLPVASGIYLDNLGKLLGVARYENENDDQYRMRMREKVA